MLDVRGVGKSFGDVVVLADVTFTVDPGEVVALTGVNGSGKSTLLRCIVGWDTIDTGQVLFEGKTFDEGRAAVRAAVAVGIEPGMDFSDLTAREHLEFMARAHGNDTPDSIVGEVLDELDLTVVADHFPFALSQGQQRRMGLASCFCAAPPVVDPGRAGTEPGRAGQGVAGRKNLGGTSSRGVGADGLPQPGSGRSGRRLRGHFGVGARRRPAGAGGPRLTASHPAGGVLEAPVAARPTSFGRYLRRAAARRRKATRSTVRYTVVVFLLWYLPAPVFGVSQGLTAPPPASHPLTLLAGVALLLTGCAAVGWAASVAGPISASREWRAWVSSTPLDRNAVLRRRATAALGLAWLPGLALGALVADGIGVRRVPALTVVLAAGFSAVTAAAAATCWQRRMSGRVALTRWQTVIAAFITVAAPMSLIHTTTTTPAGWWWWGAADSAVIALVGCWMAMATLGTVPMTALTGGAGSGASLLAAAQEQSLAPLARC